ncbi:MAG: glucose-1-phosphate thymidylyltransferase [Anaerolineaceae bacterium]|nr:glucose-1-phosphate thymidylyltransferase [Anaerolineaceae bacterium]
MKAVILAAGQGTRLRPVTLTMPKPLVPVANKALIEYAIDLLREAGLADIGIVVNSLDSPIPAQLGDGRRLGVRLEYIVQEVQQGLAHAASLAQPFTGDEPFCMFLGDNLFKDRLADLLADFPASGAEAAVALTEVPDPERFGIAELNSDGGRIQRVVEKPQNPVSNLAISGVYLFRPSIYEAIGNIRPSWRNELEITDAIGWLISQGRQVQPYILQGWWIDAGKPESIILANQVLLGELPYTPPPTNRDQVCGDSEVSHRVLIGRDSQIINSVVRGPVIIGDKVCIRNSYVGPYTAIGNNVVVEGSEIEASIVMKECVIRNMPGRIDSSLLADNSQVTSAEHLPAAHRLILAENSYVQL